jgi:hypothetical protein
MEANGSPGAAEPLDLLDPETRECGCMETLPMEENQMPLWAQELYERIAWEVQFRDGLSLVDACYYGPEDTHWGCHFLEVAPAQMEIVGAGPCDGERTHGIIDQLDLMRIASGHRSGS